MSRQPSVRKKMRTIKGEKKWYGDWVSTAGGKEQIYGHKFCTEKQAQDALNRSLHERADKASVRGTIASYANGPRSDHKPSYFEALEANKEIRESTRRFYRLFVGSFVDAYGTNSPFEIDVNDVNYWLDTNDQWKNKHNPLRALKHFLRYLDAASVLNPKFKYGMIKRAKPETPEIDLVDTPEKHAAVLAAVGDNPKDSGFVDFLNMLWHTSARPFELMRAQLKHVSADRTYFTLKAGTGENSDTSKQKSGGKAFRHIVPDSDGQKILERICAGLSQPGDYLFTNQAGQPFIQQILSIRFKRINKKLGTHYVPKNYRKSATTRWVKARRNPQDIQKLNGWANLSMLKFYDYDNNPEDLVAVQQNQGK